VTQKTEVYATSFASAKTKNGDVWKLVKGIWQPLGAFVSTPAKPSVNAFSLAFVEDMAYATSLTHGVRCARRIDVENFDGTNPIEWLDYPALPVDRVTRITATNDLQSGRTRLYLGTIDSGAYEVQRQIYFVLEKSTFGRDDFTILAGGTQQHTYDKRQDDRRAERQQADRRHRRHSRRGDQRCRGRARRIRRCRGCVASGGRAADRLPGVADRRSLPGESVSGFA
jgi:hypothetical protein